MDLFDFKEVKYLERDTNTPTFFGKIDSEVGKGGQVMITLGDRNFFVDINPQDGSWKWTPPEALADGEYSISFMTIDTAGNLSTPSQRTLIVDTTPPGAPTLLNLYDDQGAITGSFDAGKMTDDRRPTLTGIAEKGTVVYLKEGNTVIGSAKADEKTGLWTLEPTVDLADGRHNLTLVAAETFADKLREGKPSDEFIIVIGKDGDNQPKPGVNVEIRHAIDDDGENTGLLKSGGITDDTSPKLYGSSTEGNDVLIQYRNNNGQWIDGGKASIEGDTWTWTPNPALQAGNWEFRANAGFGWSDEFKLNIDSNPALLTEITHAWDDSGKLTGMLGNGAITDDRIPTLHGRAESNSTVYLFYRNILGDWDYLDTVITDADGHWEYNTDRLPVASYEFQASSTPTRNINGKTFSMQIIAPDSFTPTIEAAFDNTGPRQGNKSTGDITDDTTPEIKGKAESNSVVYIEYTNGSESFLYSVTANPSGDWSLTPPPLSYGEWKFEAYSINSKKNLFNLTIKESDFISSKEIFSESGLFNLIQYQSKTLNSGLTINTLSGVVRNTKWGNESELDRRLFIGKFDPASNNYVSSKIEFLIEQSKYFKFMFNTDRDSEVKVSYYDKDVKLIEQEVVKSFNGSNNGLVNHTFTAPENELIHKVIVENGQYIKDSKAYWDLLYMDDIEWGVDVPSDKIFDKSSHQLNIENINVLDVISIEDILSKGQKDLFIDDSKTQLMVNGNQGDTVRLEDILPEGSEQNGWAEQAGTVTIAGTQYHVWSNGDAELLVQDGVKTELV
ncbi:Ig-like domain-containing protein [Pantoea dispersa]|uniref:Ig-like domain-containing protein n=1 Tax=Pantoea dispersa TaxID=59814 RepID=UPI0021C8DA16|nr:Ig-like domain-containing protein [Pantoea dispersa]UXO68971.1 Ig-like domain-containing protein [Pantoea dispersa]